MLKKKGCIFSLILFSTIIFNSCRYDDSDLWNSVNDLESRVTSLEQMCNQMNTNITSLQTILYALQENDYITAVNPLYEGENHIGYTIEFTKSPTVTIYHGKDGQDGINGADGLNGNDGANGTDGYTPKIGISQDVDGHYYWILDGDWLLDDNGNKVLAEGLPGPKGNDGKDGKDGIDGKDGVDGEDGKDGKDGQTGTSGANGADGQNGITPQFKIQEGDWYLSLDNGITWEYLGRATGDKGETGEKGEKGDKGDKGDPGSVIGGTSSGDAMFSGIDYTSSQEYVIFNLADGTLIKIPTWYAYEELKILCSQMNENISSLQSIVNAIKDNDYLLAVDPKMEDGKQVGYILTFAKSGAKEIYNGKDGAAGKDGDKGADGKDGHTPQIGVKEDSGTLYWSVDGEFLKDADGNNIPVTGKDGADGKDGQKGDKGDKGDNGDKGDKGETGEKGETGAAGSPGKDGITPQIKIEDGEWKVSTDGGETWESLGSAKGEKGDTGAAGKNGKDGDSFFQSVNNEDPDYLVLTLANGTEIKVPKSTNLSISLDVETPLAVKTNSTIEIGYRISGNTNSLQVEALSSGNVKAKISSSSSAQGTLTIMTGSTLDEYDKVVMLVSNGQRTIMSTITFEASILRVMNGAIEEIPIEGGSVTITVETNLNYQVKIPSSAQKWIQQTPTRSLRQESITFEIENNLYTPREALIELVDNEGNLLETVLIKQAGGSNIYIPDSGFLDYCVQADIDKNRDRIITVEEAAAATQLIITSTYNVNSLEGIEYFINIDILRINDNNLSSLDVSKCTKLKELQCNNNKLEYLNVSGCTELIRFYCSSNQLTSLDVSKTNLGESGDTYPLNCSNNPSLKTLYLKKGWSINGITDDKKRSASYIPDDTDIQFVE
ncbi:MAG: hypothetical protein J1F38_00420 [Muribaculaceae bacterium]|nr:hypothetical protein [Muribaculaceae bacterium]